MSLLRRRLRLLGLRALGALLRTQRQTPLPSPAEYPRHPCILLVRPDHVGDVLLSTPVVVYLRRALPGAHLTWMVGPWSYEVVRRGPPADEVLLCPFPGFQRRPKDSHLSPYSTLLRYRARLRPARYDMALILRPDHWWGAMLTATAGIPIRVGYDVPENLPFLTHALPACEPTHAVARSLALAQAAVRIITHQELPHLPEDTPTFRMEDTDQRRADQLLTGLPPDMPLLAIHVGSGSPLKSWLPRRWAAVADGLAARFGAQVVLTGGPGEGEMVDAVRAYMRSPAHVLVGQTDLGSLAAVFLRCRLVLGADSGPLHLATALGVPTVRLYGPTDPRVFGPWGDAALHQVVHARLPCQPCGNLESPPCRARREPPCLQAVSVESVAGTAEAILAKTLTAEREAL